jgi:DNA-binding NarL/FixJ family response regulator
MPDSSAVERIRRLRERFPGTEIVITMMHENRVLADQVLKAGAMAFVLKDRADVELCEGVRSAARRQQYTSLGLGRA